MPQTIYFWRRPMEIPMLTEEEWALVEPHFRHAIQQIKRYRQEHPCSLAEATAEFPAPKRKHHA
jgi:hypothetical protein